MTPEQQGTIVGFVIGAGTVCAIWCWWNLCNSVEQWIGRNR